VLLVHRPSYFEQVVRLGLPLAIAGHTHGGQVALPAPLQHHNIARLMTTYTRGLFESENSLMYVNRGLGVAGPPIRLNCPREIARLELVAR
jgi:predicted MPP superfamily phosphohydrolase